MAVSEGPCRREETIPAHPADFAAEALFDSEYRALRPSMTQSRQNGPSIAFHIPAPPYLHCSNPPGKHGSCPRCRFATPPAVAHRPTPSALLPTTGHLQHVETVKDSPHA